MKGKKREKTNNDSSGVMKRQQHSAGVGIE